MKTVLIVLFMMTASVAVAQKFESHVPIRKAVYDNKFVWGFTFTQYWSTVEGSALTQDYFAKPSSGLMVSAEYYPVSFLGIGLGLGFQQRGAGIVHHNVTPSDSSFRERLRFNTVEIPISVVLRTPKDLLPGFRLSGSLAVVPMVNLRSLDVLNVLEPSIHDTDVIQDVSSSYFRNDVAVQLSAGPEFNYGAGFFRIHFAYSRGSANVYSTGSGKGNNQTIGFRLSALF